MKPVLAFVLVLLSVLHSGRAYCPAGRQAKLFAVDGSPLGDQTPGPSSLYEVDPADGSYTLVGELGLNYDHVVGLAACPFTSQLYALNNVEDGNTELLKVNPETGAATTIGETGWQIPDMAFGPDGILYGWAEWDGDDARPDDLLIIDTSTGMVTFQDDFGQATARTGIAVDHSGTILLKTRLWPSNSQELHTVSATGSKLTTVAMDKEPTNSLAFSPDSIVYTATAGSPTSTLQRIDSTTGAVTDIGETLHRLSALTFRCETGLTGGAAVGAIIGIIFGFILLLVCCCACMGWMSNRARRD